MANLTSSLQPVPMHVPEHLVVDFDALRPDEVERDVHLAWKRVQNENPDIFYTPRNGGHWVADARDEAASRASRARYRFQ
jgi:hypothetical protein